MASITGLYTTTAWVLGLKGTMSEAELHILRARLEGGVGNKAARFRTSSEPANRIRVRQGASTDMLSS